MLPSSRPRVQDFMVSHHHQPLNVSSSDNHSITTMTNKSFLQTKNSRFNTNSNIVRGSLDSSKQTLLNQSEIEAIKSELISDQFSKRNNVSFKSFSNNSFQMRHHSRQANSNI